LKESSGHQIKFITDADDTLVKQALSKAKALLFPGEEDFGIVVLEAMACQTPVIAYRRGGAIDTVTSRTGLFFLEQTKESLSEAIVKFENIPESFWKKENFLEHVNKFSKENFKKQFLEVVLKQLEEKKNN
ncbi:glycosyltransferase, partial [Parasutterella excrementihominis]